MLSDGILLRYLMQPHFLYFGHGYSQLSFEIF